MPLASDSADYREGIAAFREKRRSRWSGHPASDLTVGAEDHLLVLSSREQASRMVERLGVRQGRAPGEGARG